jgi:hypothetical protein
MVMASWQLWLARDCVRDAPLPWQKPLPQLTLGRVADSIAPLLARLGTPTQPPKPRGKSPGWQTGRQRTLSRRAQLFVKRRRLFTKRQTIDDQGFGCTKLSSI